MGKSCLEQRTAAVTQLVQPLCCFCLYWKRSSPAAQGPQSSVSASSVFLAPIMWVGLQLPLQEQVAGDMQGSPVGLQTWVLSTTAADTEKEAGVAGGKESVWGMSLPFPRLLQPREALRGTLSLLLGLESPVSLESKFSLCYLKSLLIFCFSAVTTFKLANISKGVEHRLIKFLIRVHPSRENSVQKGWKFRLSITTLALG